MTIPAKKFSTKRKSQIIPIEGEDGVERNYMLVELNGTGRDAYLNTLNKRIRIEGKEQTTHIREFTGMCSDLLSMCLLGPDSRPVPAAEINDWPASMQMELFKMAQEMSGLDKEDKDKEEGN